MSLKIRELIAKLIRESVCVLRVKATLLLDVLGIDEDFTVDGLELIGAWSEHLHDDVWSLPQWRELVAVLVVLDEAEHQVPDVEGLTLYSTAVVPAQCLLVLGRAEEGDVTRFT